MHPSMSSIDWFCYQYDYFHHPSILIVIIIDYCLSCYHFIVSCLVIAPRYANEHVIQNTSGELKLFNRCVSLI